MTDPRAGGAAPDFQKAREALDRIQKYWSTAGAQDVLATLDQAESEIARLREENAALLNDVQDA